MLLTRLFGQQAPQVDIDELLADDGGEVLLDDLLADDGGEVLPDDLAPQAMEDPAAAQNRGAAGSGYPWLSRDDDGAMRAMPLPAKKKEFLDYAGEMLGGFNNAVSPYVAVGGGGAAAGAVAGAPFAGVGAGPGAVAGGLAGVLGLGVADLYGLGENIVTIGDGNWKALPSENIRNSLNAATNAVGLDRALVAPGEFSDESAFFGTVYPYMVGAVDAAATAAAGAGATGLRTASNALKQAAASNNNLAMVVKPTSPAGRAQLNAAQLELDDALLKAQLDAQASNAKPEELAAQLARISRAAVEKAAPGFRMPPKPLNAAVSGVANAAKSRGGLIDNIRNGPVTGNALLDAPIKLFAGNPVIDASVSTVAQGATNVAQAMGLDDPALQLALGLGSGAVAGRAMGGPVDPTLNNLRKPRPSEYYDAEISQKYQEIADSGYKYDRAKIARQIDAAIESLSTDGLTVSSKGLLTALDEFKARTGPATAAEIDEVRRAADYAATAIARDEAIARTPNSAGFTRPQGDMGTRRVALIQLRNAVRNSMNDPDNLAGRRTTMSRRGDDGLFEPLEQAATRIRELNAEDRALLERPEVVAQSETIIDNVLRGAPFRAPVGDGFVDQYANFLKAQDQEFLAAKITAGRTNKKGGNKALLQNLEAEFRSPDTLEIYRRMAQDEVDKTITKPIERELAKAREKYGAAVPPEEIARIAQMTRARLGDVYERANLLEADINDGLVQASDLVEAAKKMVAESGNTSSSRSPLTDIEAARLDRANRRATMLNMLDENTRAQAGVGRLRNPLPLSARMGTMLATGEQQRDTHFTIPFLDEVARETAATQKKTEAVENILKNAGGTGKADSIRTQVNALLDAYGSFYTPEEQAMLRSVSEGPIDATLRGVGGLAPDYKGVRGGLSLAATLGGLVGTFATGGSIRGAAALTAAGGGLALGARATANARAERQLKNALVAMQGGDPTLNAHLIGPSRAAQLTAEMIFNRALPALRGTVAGATDKPNDERKKRQELGIRYDRPSLVD